MKTIRKNLNRSALRGLLGAGLVAFAIAWWPNAAEAAVAHPHHPHVAHVRHRAPVVHLAAPAVRSVVVAGHAGTWVPGHNETVTETVVVAPGHYEKQWMPPVYQTVVNSAGTSTEVKIKDGHYKDVWVAAKTETRTKQVWIAGHYE
jgi:hypothetical protein